VKGVDLTLMALAKKTTAGLFFYHNDPAGTPMAMTNRNMAIIWEADYKPFGEEQIITALKENNRMFVGKEKDKETGLYYFGARYMNDKIGRFISVDPIGPIDEKTGKVNEKMLLNPQRLNRYAYGLNNPYRYVDRDGMWGEDVHSGIGNVKYGTYIWARKVGFSDKDAKIIAKGNNATDAGPWSNWLPLLGDQSRHFNQPYLFPKGIGDTRDYWANVEFQRALKYAKEGDYEAALGHLGKGLHSLQDKYAHGDWDTGALGLAAHPPSYDDWNNPRNKEAAEATFKGTMEYLKKFKEQTK